jgi:hypothetical protein
MRILLFTKEAGDTPNRRREILEANFRDRGLETFSTIDRLARGLREPSEEAKIGILLIQDPQDLKRILSIQNLFQDVPLIIQVPDESAETLQMAHRLRPRYLSGAQDDFGTLLEVLRNMLNKGENQIHSPLQRNERR